MSIINVLIFILFLLLILLMCKNRIKGGMLSDAVLNKSEFLNFYVELHGGCVEGISISRLPRNVRLLHLCTYDLHYGITGIMKEAIFNFNGFDLTSISNVHDGKFNTWLKAPQEICVSSGNIDNISMYTDSILVTESDSTGIVTREGIVKPTLPPVIGTEVQFDGRDGKILRQLRDGNYAFLPKGFEDKPENIIVYPKPKADFQILGTDKMSMGVAQLPINDMLGLKMIKDAQRLPIKKVYNTKGERMTDYKRIVETCRELLAPYSYRKVIDTIDEIIEKYGSRPDEYVPPNKEEEYDLTGNEMWIEDEMKKCSDMYVPHLSLLDKAKHSAETIKEREKIEENRKKVGEIYDLSNTDGEFSDIIGLKTVQELLRNIPSGRVLLSTIINELNRLHPTKYITIILISCQPHLTMSKETNKKNTAPIKTYLKDYQESDLDIFKRSIPSLPPPKIEVKEDQTVMLLLPKVTDYMNTDHYVNFERASPKEYFPQEAYVEEMGDDYINVVLNPDSSNDAYGVHMTRSQFFDNISYIIN